MLLLLSLMACSGKSEPTGNGPDQTTPSSTQLTNDPDALVQACIDDDGCPEWAQEVNAEVAASLGEARLTYLASLDFSTVTGDQLAEDIIFHDLMTATYEALEGRGLVPDARRARREGDPMLNLAKDFVRVAAVVGLTAAACPPCIPAIATGVAIGLALPSDASASSLPPSTLVDPSAAEDAGVDLPDPLLELAYGSRYYQIECDPPVNEIDGCWAFFFNGDASAFDAGTRRDVNNNEITDASVFDCPIEEANTFVCENEGGKSWAGAFTTADVFRLGYDGVSTCVGISGCP